ncbi:MAG: hypothetical protein K0U39_05500 [Alphaproteobacteria bacterium]|nr:hypothetical protein [Alphaproteobacteria bacterium]
MLLIFQLNETMIKISHILKLLLPMLVMLSFSNFSKAEVLNYKPPPKEKNWWVMASSGNISHNLHHGLYTARWGSNVQANTEVQNLYLGISYGYVLAKSDQKEYHIDIGYSFLGRINYELSHRDFPLWKPEETLTITAWESSFLFYYGRKSQGKPHMLRIGFAFPNVENEITNADGSTYSDNSFYTNSGPVLGYGIRFGNIVLEYKIYMITFGSQSRLFEEQRGDFSNGAYVLLAGYRF